MTIDEIKNTVIQGDYEIVIPSYLTFLSALKDNINSWTCDEQADDERVYLDTDVIGQCVKEAIEASRAGVEK